MLPLALGIVGALAKDRPLDPASWRMVHEKLRTSRTKFVEMDKRKLLFVFETSISELPPAQQEQLHLLAVMASGVVATPEMLANLWDQVGGQAPVADYDRWNHVLLLLLLLLLLRLRMLSVVAVFAALSPLRSTPTLSCLPEVSSARVPDRLTSQHVRDVPTGASVLVGRSLLQCVSDGYRLHDLVLEYLQLTIGMGGARLAGKASSRQARHLARLDVLEGYVSRDHDISAQYSLMALWNSVKKLDGTVDVEARYLESLQGVADFQIMAKVGMLLLFLVRPTFWDFVRSVLLLANVLPLNRTTCCDQITVSVGVSAHCANAFLNVFLSGFVTAQVCEDPDMCGDRDAFAGIKKITWPGKKYSARPCDDPAMCDLD